MKLFPHVGQGVFGFVVGVFVVALVLVLEVARFAAFGFFLAGELRYEAVLVSARVATWDDERECVSCGASVALV